MTKEGASGKTLDPRRVSPEGRFDHPRLYLVGEAPGAEEAEAGRPFVGPAGEALRAMLREAGIDPDQTRLANALPRRPVEGGKEGDKNGPRNRAPSRAEIARHGGAVLADIRRAKPGAIVALGASAARLFGETRPLAEARGAALDFEGRPLIVTYHPAYARRFGGPDGAPWRQAVSDLRRAWKASG